MTQWLPALVLLACPVGMGLMMFFMMRGKKSDRPDPREQEVARLRAEVDQLRAGMADQRPAEESKP